ncbi:hypothetical protein DFJ73DRAFT_881085 [Zopfochytrium polystomum]|nr:hypothetical protein DFJ73DRAFT_881085 [Zopfochytrium polystomum]
MSSADLLAEFPGQISLVSIFSDNTESRRMKEQDSAGLAGSSVDAMFFFAFYAYTIMSLIGLAHHVPPTLCFAAMCALAIARSLWRLINLFRSLPVVATCTVFKHLTTALNGWQTFNLTVRQDEGKAPKEGDENDSHEEGDEDVVSSFPIQFVVLQSSLSFPSRLYLCVPVCECDCCFFI